MLDAPHGFTLRQLQYAVAVAEELSFRRAAERCGVSQPSLSAQVAELEQQFGVQLFERDRRRVLVTAAGERLLAACRTALLSADDLQSLADSLGDSTAGILRLGAIPTIAPYLVPFATQCVRKQRPELTLHWIEDKTENLVRDINSGRLDGAVLALEAEVGALAHELIASDPFVLVAEPGHPLVTDEEPISRRKLRSLPVLLLDDGHCFRDQVLEVCSTSSATAHAFRATSLPTLVQLVAQGVGVTLLPELALPVEMRRAKLELRRLQAPEPARTIVMVWRPRSSLGPILKEVAGWIRDAYPVPVSEPRRTRKAKTPAPWSGS